MVSFYSEIEGKKGDFIKVNSNGKWYKTLLNLLWGIVALKNLKLDLVTRELSKKRLCKLELYEIE